MTLAQYIARRELALDWLAHWLEGGGRAPCDVVVAWLKAHQGQDTCRCDPARWQRVPTRDRTPLPLP